MNQNDMDRYRWRTGQRWSGDRVSRFNERRRRTKISLAVIILGFCVFLALVLSLHGCGPVVNAQFDSHQRALEDKKLKEIHGRPGNTDLQFAEAMKAADQQSRAKQGRAGKPAGGKQ